MTEGMPLGAGVAFRLADADPRVVRFLDAWRQARRGALVPLRDAFDPMAIPGLLGCVWMYRFDPALDDFVCRLAGEEVNAAWGGSIRGRTLREIVGDANHPRVIARWRRMLAGPSIQYGAAAEHLSEGRSRHVERLVLPLASAPGVLDRTLGISLYALAAPSLTPAILVPAEVIQIPCAEL